MKLRRAWWRALIVLVFLGATGVGRAATSALRVTLVAPDRAAASELAALHSALISGFGFETVTAGASTAGAAPLAGALAATDVAVFVHGPGALDPAEAQAVRAFLAAGRGCVVLGGAGRAWPTEPDFETQVLGARAGGAFADGAALTLINLFPHPIFGGIPQFDTELRIPLFTSLAEDVQMIMEGTVGEATAPLAWVRRRAGGRLVHLVPAEARLFRDPTYQRLVAQAALWAAGRPIPAARPAVQRTFMPEATPGSFAITLPNGPGLCLDPVRGGVNYVWEGDFVDLRPRWITKEGAPARIFGEVFYREKAWQPLRAGAPGNPPDFQFRGYVLRDGVPEFHYVIGGRDVFETFASGRQPGDLLRRFRVGPGTAPLWLNLEPQTDAEVVVSGLERDGARAVFAVPAGGEFTLEIRRRKGLIP
ncbi:MAG: ThuA domain-containing protein [Opitutaceae bacterium]|nr:ThuA domain-containing protein [Opitutaceae bacterium]